MRVRVEYTAEFTREDLIALAAYTGATPTRADLKAALRQVGEMGVEEQIAEGQFRLDNRPQAPDAPR